MKYKCLEKLGMREEKKESRVIKFVNKTLMAIFLGLVFLIIMEYSPKFKTFMQKDVLDNNISFGFLGKLYNKYFGEVLPTNNDNVVKVFKEKITYKAKEKYHDGYKLMVDNNYLIPVINGGVVVYLGEKEDYGKVIVIEGEDGVTITYGNIKNTDLKLYNYVTSGSYLGEANGDYIYITILKNGEYLDLETYLS